jgi:hypothetical protein
MVAPDYQEFTNRAKSDTRDNTVICGVGTSELAEISQALRDYHAAKRARKRNFLPMGGLIGAIGGRNCRE